MTKSQIENEREEVARRARIAPAVAALRALSQEDRFSALSLFCCHCGGDDPRCYCMRDD